MNPELRDKLAHAGRILESEGQGDYILGHVTVRLPEDPTRMLMKPASIGLEEMTRDAIITIDIEGEKVAGHMPRHAEVFIHTEVMRARPEVQAVVHTHAPYAVAFGALGRPLQSVSHDGVYFADGLPVFAETTDLIVNQQLGRAVARTLAKHDAMLLRNHGIVTVGRSLEEAVFLAVHLEKACKIQLLVESCGGAKAVTDREEAIAKKKRQAYEGRYQQEFAYLARRGRAGR
ncbi:MAG TPA: class II aldolase/adducin family protein [Stellaceae bacterium]|nr:class II aldolase/adducin family protein [Stellaceae bacterium]